MSALEIIARARVVPAIVLDDPAKALPLASAMHSGGMPLAEVTLRTGSALAAIREMSRLSGLCVGAGTVTSVSQADQAIEAGAAFIVTPGLDDSVIRRCQERNVPVIPGAVTPTEIMRAMNLGIGLVKFFPCHAFGGLAAIQALAGPFPGMRFLPTGGISPENLRGFLSHPNVTACGGTWMVKKEWLAESKFSLIEQACEQTRDLVRQMG